MKTFFMWAVATKRGAILDLYKHKSEAVDCLTDCYSAKCGPFRVVKIKCEAMT